MVYKFTYSFPTTVTFDGTENLELVPTVPSDYPKCKPSTAEMTGTITLTIKAPAADTSIPFNTYVGAVSSFAFNIKCTNPLTLKPTGTSFSFAFKIKNIEVCKGSVSSPTTTAGRGFISIAFSALNTYPRYTSKLQITVTRDQTVELSPIKNIKVDTVFDITGIDSPSCIAEAGSATCAITGTRTITVTFPAIPATLSTFTIAGVKYQNADTPSDQDSKRAITISTFDTDASNNLFLAELSPSTSIDAMKLTCAYPCKECNGQSINTLFNLYFFYLANCLSCYAEDNKVRYRKQRDDTTYE